jgi:hypothetical protein
MTDSGREKRIQNRLKRVKRLFVHLALTLMIVLGIIYAVDQLGISARIEDDMIPIVVLLFIAHALWVMYQEAENFITQQETQRADAPEEKPKHYLALDDDGELTEIIEDEMVWDEKLKHSE